MPGSTPNPQLEKHAGGHMADKRGDQWAGLRNFTDIPTEGCRVAVLIPCYNEEKPIAEVVRDFKAQLPGAEIYVFDNDSTDQTVKEARQAGAIVRYEKRRGKGYVIRSMFRQVDADIYVMVDGDGTYPA